MHEAVLVVTHQVVFDMLKSLDLNLIVMLAIPVVVLPRSINKAEYSALDAPSRRLRGVTDLRMGRRPGGRTEGQTDRRTDGPTDRSTDGHTLL